MKRIRTLIGLPVIMNEKRIGRVIRCQLSQDLTRLEGIWIAAVFFGARFIPCEDLCVIGQVSIVSDSHGQRRKPCNASLFRRAIGTDGSRIGAITGAEIDELSFRVDALELSRGIWDDLLGGRILVKTFTLNQATGDVIIDASNLWKEEKQHEKQDDERSDHRSCSGRLGSYDVRHHELAVGTADEPSDEENRSLDR